MIKIDKWEIESNEMHVTLYKCLKKGRRIVGFYPDFQSTLSAMVKKDIQNLDSLEEMCNRLDDLDAKISMIGSKNKGVKSKRKG